MGRYVKPNQKYYALKYPDGKFAGMDHHSGGYPFPTENINEINYWGEDQLEEMKKYMEGTKLIPFEVIVSISETPFKPFTTL